VRAWRVAAGLSQRQLAERANYGQQYVAKVESGERLASEHGPALVFERAAFAAFVAAVRDGEFPTV
jgi:transcriptional regulator with XRE-family HTH domain